MSSPNVSSSDYLKSLQDFFANFGTSATQLGKDAYKAVSDAVKEEVEGILETQSPGQRNVKIMELSKKATLAFVTCMSLTIKTNLTLLAFTGGVFHALAASKSETVRNMDEKIYLYFGKGAAQTTTVLGAVIVACLKKEIVLLAGSYYAGKKTVGYFLAEPKKGPEKEKQAPGGGTGTSGAATSGAGSSSSPNLEPKSEGEGDGFGSDLD